MPDPDAVTCLYENSTAGHVEQFPVTVSAERGKPEYAYRVCLRSALDWPAGPNAVRLAVRVADGRTSAYAEAVLPRPAGAVSNARLTRSAPGQPTHPETTMAAVPTGTPVAVVWASGASPAAQNITIPSDATAVYMFWAGFFDGGPASVTLNGAAPSQAFEVPGSVSGPLTGTGVLAWYSPATGTRSLAVTWDNAPSEGAVCIVAYVKDGDTTAWRDADGDTDELSVPVSATLTTVAGDLVFKFDQKYGGTPSLSSGWTNGQTTSNNGEGARLSYISASGTTQVCNSEDEDFSTIVCVAIPAGAGGGATSYVPPSFKRRLMSLLQL